ncbi:MAG: hypothetical protein ACYDBV_15275, partial [Nitrospiria bacterium]
MDPQQILNSNANTKKLELFQFDASDSNDDVGWKFLLWSRHFFPKYFKTDDSKFHRVIDLNNIRLYRGEIRSFTNIAFRGAAKTSRTKLFIPFCLLNDKATLKRYYKILSEDLVNSKQLVTDIYNMLVDPNVRELYPYTFTKTVTKREETMQSFTTSTGIKVISDTVGTAQRGQIQEDIRPDFIWLEDFESRKTLRSAVMTKAIWDNIEEAKNGLAKGGGMLYTCNYVSERGNVHKLVLKESRENVVMITPIKTEDGPVWPQLYPATYIEGLQKDADDFEGEYMCEPSASKDIMFDRRMVDKQKPIEPIKEIAGLKMFYDYDSSHRYAGGCDISGGVGLDSSTNVIIDFDTLPSRVVATFKTNIIKPDTFGDEIASHGRRFGECLLAPEKNNHGHATIGRLKQIYDLSKIFKMPGKDVKQDQSVEGKSIEYGWHTNAASKPKMIYAFKKAVEDGLIELNDK